jgi:hypothetical protein
MTRDRLISNAIAKHGAAAMHAAAQRALEGDYAPIRALGFDAQSLGDAFAAQLLAHKRMTPGEQALEKIHAEHAYNTMDRKP